MSGISTLTITEDVTQPAGPQTDWVAWLRTDDGINWCRCRSAIRPARNARAASCTRWCGHARNPMVEFDCEGCGAHVSMFGRDRVPANHWCATCGFIHWSVRDPGFVVQRELLVHLGVMKPLRRITDVAVEPCGV